VRSSGICPREVFTANEATVETVEPRMKKLKKDYTSVTARTWSEESQISLSEGDAAIVAKADGSICLHMPGDMDAVSLGHAHAMLMSMVMSGTPGLEPIYKALCEAQGHSLDCASAPEDVVH